MKTNSPMVSPRSLILAALPAALLLASCKSSDKKTTLPKNLPKINVSSSESSPPHRMSRGEYPFDSRGNYVTSWAAEGPRGGASSAADYDSWSDSHDSRTTVPVVASSSPSTRTSAPTMVLSSSSSTSSPSRPAASVSASTRSNQSSSSRPTTTSSRPSSSSSTPSSSSAPKKTTTTKTSSSSSSSAYHTVKSGDTLYGLALRYKSSVAKIKSANGLKSDLIRPGQKLRVPR